VRPELRVAFAAAFVQLVTGLPSQADVILTEGTNFAVDVSPVDGSIAMDLMGSIWVLPAEGGEAQQLTDGLIPVTAPRWSPDGASILYEVRATSGAEIWRLQMASSTSQRITSEGDHDQDASWHPQGDRIVYASERHDSGLDIWETDLPTGLSWRISSHPGDESEPVWSMNGRHLSYVRKTDDDYRLVLRRQGETERDLVISDTPLSSPSWRPDGSLITFLRHGEGQPTLEMVILSEPPLARVIATDENHFSSPVSWRDRTRLYYTADGSIKTRGFEDRRSRSLPFRAVIPENDSPAPRTIPNRELTVSSPPSGRLVIRGARLFDGIWKGYREQMDVLIEAGLVVEVAPRREWNDATILDLGNVTVLPGLIDVWSGAPGDEQDGPAILAYGVTTIVSPDNAALPIAHTWDDEMLPGPRVLPAATVSAETVPSDDSGFFLVRMLPADAAADKDRNAVQAWRDRGVPIISSNWVNGRRIGADILLGADALPSASQHNPDQAALPGAAPAPPPVLISALADAGTPGISALIDSRQAATLEQRKRPGRRIAGAPQLATMQALVVAGSRPNGLRAAGLSGEQVLRSAGPNAAKMLGLDNQIGTITPGAMADMVLVGGDPLDNVDDLLRIVAVVRNGRFFSLVSLLERATSPRTVE
jgi:dipeptidyl aminopeptidase/acylaminoacyl peptidase